MIASLNPKYISLVQKPSCCNVACLQMILYRRGFGLFDQQELAKYFDIKVGKDESKSFNVRLGIYNSTNCDEGLKTIESEKLINLFFKEKSIALTAKAVRASHIGNLKKFILTNIKNDNDLWLEYKTHELHKAELIHDNVVESISVNSQKSVVTLIDPYWAYKPRLKVDVKKISESISDKYGRETGFIIISGVKA